MEAYRTDPELDRIHWLVHGFGTRALDLAGLEALAGLNRMHPVILHQIHSATVLTVEDILPDRTEADAMITDRTGLLLTVKTADCLPIFLVDETRRAVAAVHAGWRGTAAGIASAAVAAMRDRLGSRPADLRASLGPCIGAGCYEVGEDVLAAFGPSGAPFLAPIPNRPGRYLLDLPAANRRRLEESGVPPSRIGPAAACTHCDPELLSWRRDRRSDARLYSFIGILG